MSGEKVRRQVSFPDGFLAMQAWLGPIVGKKVGVMGPAAGSFGLLVGKKVGVSVLGLWVELDVSFDVVGASDGDVEGRLVL